MNQLLKVSASCFKIRVEVKAGAGRRQRNDVPRLCALAGKLDRLLHIFCVQDAQLLRVKAFAGGDSRFDFRRGYTHQDEGLDLFDDFGCKRLKGDFFVVAARNQDELLVEGV